MVDSAALIAALPAPAALLGRDGRPLAVNDAFRACGAAADNLARLKAGERLETGRLGGGAWVWRVADLPGGQRLATAEPGVVAGPSGRERYLAALSHELRTPLNGVLGMAGLLGRTRLGAEQKAYVAALKDSGEHLLGLVNDVLDLAKLESGQLDLEPHPIDVEQLLQGVTELLSPRAHEKGLQIAWGAPAGLPRILADDGRLRQILFNLAGNAIKFTEAGGVLLTVEPQAQTAPTPAALGERRLRFAVADTGPGVPEADQARIFEEFARLDGPQQRLEGAGLGLAIVRRLAQAHDGVVGLSPRPGGGSIFWFEAVFRDAGPAPAAGSLAGVVLAVVSASPIVAEAARLQIEACGGRALAYDSLDAAAAAPAEAVLLVDVAAGRRPPPGRSAIVLVTPEERGRIGRLRRAGFAGYLIKPLRRASLAERVRAVIGAAEPPAGQAAGEDERAAAAAGVGLRVLLAEDNPINALLARSLLEREGCIVHRAPDGRAAVQAASVAVYDLILMDLRMPGMDGLEAAGALRSLGVTTPIVALTADAFEDDRKGSVAAGMDDFLTKPLDVGALRAVLGRWAGFTRPLPEAKLAS